MIPVSGLENLPFPVFDLENLVIPSSGLETREMFDIAGAELTDTIPDPTMDLDLSSLSWVILKLKRM